MIRITSILIVLLPLAVGLFACASQDEIKAERVAQQAATEAEDDTVCRASGEPGSQAYDTCRAEKTAERARQADIDYQKARDFDRVLGGLDDL